MVTAAFTAVNDIPLPLELVHTVLSPKYIRMLAQYVGVDPTQQKFLDEVDATLNMFLDQGLGFQSDDATLIAIKDTVAERYLKDRGFNRLQNQRYENTFQQGQLRDPLVLVPSVPDFHNRPKYDSVDQLIQEHHRYTEQNGAQLAELFIANESKVPFVGTQPWTQDFASRVLRL
jgi:hypothetical protein